MTPLLFIILILGLSGTNTNDHHMVDIIYVDSETEDMTYDYTLDGEEYLYANFSKQQLVYTLPAFAKSIVCGNCYAVADRNRETSKMNLEVFKKAEKNPPETQDAPVVMMYPKEHVVLGQGNSLVCFVNEFYPPSVKVRWTKNDQQVTAGVTTGRYIVNTDETFYVFSTLLFTPQEGDIYSCTVEHRALDSPVTRMWEPDVRRPSIGPDVFCGLGLTVGLLGVATGTFFLIKGNHRQG